MELLIRLIVALVVGAVIIAWLPLDSLITGCIALLAFFLILFGPLSPGTLRRPR